MKNSLRILVVAIAMMSMTQVNAAISAFCFTDVFGYVADVSATKTGIGHWELSGTADIGAGTDWIVSGSYDKGTDIWTLTYTNPVPDGCASYTDYFIYTSTSYGGGTINFNWTSYCFGAPLSSGSGSTTYSLGHCVLKLDDEREPIGPMSTDESIIFKPVTQIESVPGGSIFGDLFEVETLSVSNTGDNNIGINYELVDDTKVEINIYNHVGQLITTLVNESKSKGFYTANWNGQSLNGANANTGMYIVELKTDKGALTSKFIK